MHGLRFGGWIAALALVAATTTTATAGEYRDASGFSLTYPDDWTAFNKDMLAQGFGALPPEIASWIDKNKVDLGRLNVMVLRNGTEEFLENINVVVNPQQMPMEEDSVKKLQEMLPEQYRSMGAQVEKFEARVAKIGARDVIVIEHDSRLPNIPIPLKQRQVYFAGGGKTFIVTCTGERSSFAKYAPTFDSILASFEVPVPVKHGFDFKQIIIAGVVGGAAAGAAALINIYRNRSKAA